MITEKLGLNDGIWDICICTPKAKNFAHTNFARQICVYWLRLTKLNVKIYNVDPLSKIT